MSHFINRFRRSRMAIESADILLIFRLRRSRTLRRLNRKRVSDRCEKPMSHFISRLRRSRMSIESTDILLIFRLQRSRILRRLNKNGLQTGVTPFDDETPVDLASLQFRSLKTYRLKPQKATLSDSLCVIRLATTYSPTWFGSTIGAGGLNFSVRNGKRWTPPLKSP